MPEGRFTERTVMVFGAAGALGGGIAVALLAEGANVIGVDRLPPKKEHRLDELRYAEADATDDDSLAAFFAGEPAPWAVINTVGGFAPKTPLAELSARDLTTQLALNLVTAAMINKHALAAMTPQGEGRIVHTASRAAVDTRGSGFPYSVSKLGVLHLVKMAADEARGSGVTVNCVVPTIIDTPANRAAMPDADHGSWPAPLEVAQPYLWLASPGAHLVNGAAVPV
jgi:NAD(P)-dependent dehydrogenase (short-subunit alcohol dehydrogenase family)